MDECFKCGVTEEKARLFDAVSGEGIVKICERCSNEEEMPIIRKPTTFQLKESERRQSVYERLSGVKPGQTISDEDKWRLKKEEITLREIVDRNYKQRILPEKRPRPDLVDNFNWVIFTARRARKITQEQMAKDIGESLAAVKMAEQGILPEDDYKLINKIENYLLISLIKKKTEEPKKKQPARILKFDKNALDELTIADLQEMNKRKNESSLKEEKKTTGESIEGENINLGSSEEIEIEFQDESQE